VSDPLTVYTFVPHNSHASYYYRVFVPFRTARDLGLPVQVHIDTNDAGIDPESRVRAFFESDVVLLYQPIGEPTWYNAKAAKAFIPSLRDGKWKYPPSLVIDTDDNLFNVSPYNSAFRHLGIRDPNGNKIPKGYRIGDVQGGVRKLLWEDGKDGFDVARNQQNLETYRNLVNLSDAVTCTTPRVKESVEADASPRRVGVFPNLVRFDHYEQVRLAEEPDRLKILWQGGASHWEDWYPLRDALGALTRKYKHIHWVIWGQLYPWVAELIPPDRYTFVDWCPYQEYKLRLVMMGHQINLAPLSDSKFNRCRSAIKFYEGSMPRKPAATLAQRTGPYLDEIKDGETGLLFSDAGDFERQLSVLIENESLRTTLAKNAKDWVSENRDAFKQVPKHIAFLESLREHERMEQPHMPEADWTEFEKKARAQIEAEKAEKVEVA
jgi:glycosyltransferase involved in cell wall biosynthesis